MIKDQIVCFNPRQREATPLFSLPPLVQHPDADTLQAVFLLLQAEASSKKDNLRYLCF